MPRIVYVPPEKIAEFNRDIVNRFGGALGQGNPANLEYLDYHVRSHFNKEPFQDEVISKAADYLYQIARNRHPFTDGNKRTAIVTTETFLLANGFRLRVTNEEFLGFVLLLAAKKRRYKQVQEWVKEKVQVSP